MKWLLVLISIFLSFNGFSESVTRLEACHGDCECNAPLITSKEKFVFTPDLKSEDVLECNLNMESINGALKCAVNTSFLISCSLSTIVSVPDNLDCDDLKYEFDYPDTYKVGDLAPKNCGYSWKYFKPKQYEWVVANFLKTGKLACTKSMCTSAAFLALAQKAKELYAKKKISRKKYLELTTPNETAYKMLNNNAEPNELVEHFGLGTGHVIYPDENKDKKWNIPQAGDLTQIWRKNKSGHSVVFKGFIDRDKDGKNDYICYWSSQTKTNGYGNVCEELSTVDKLLVGHFNE